MPVIPVALLNPLVRPERLQGSPVLIARDEGPVDHLMDLVRHGLNHLGVLKVGLVLELQTLCGHGVYERAHGREHVLVDDRGRGGQLLGAEAAVVEDFDLKSCDVTKPMSHSLINVRVT